MGPGDVPSTGTAVAAAAAAATRRRVLVLAAALFLAALAVVAASQLLNRGAGDPTARDVVNGVLAEQPSTPVVLPEAPPGGYKLRAGDTVGSPDQDVPQVAWIFDPPGSRPDQVVVQVCVAREPGGCTSRLPAEADARVVDGYDVAIVPFGNLAVRTVASRLWSGTELTTAWAKLEWLDDSAADREHTDRE